MKADKERPITPMRQRNKSVVINLFPCLIGLSGVSCLIGFSLSAFLSGCASNRSLTSAVELRDDFMADRVVDAVRGRKVVGKKNFLLFKKDKYAHFLEGYIQGMITDYDDNPVAGVEVRAEMTDVSAGEAKRQEVEELVLSEEQDQSKAAGPRANFDPGSSDANGIYRVRFNLPVINGKVDVRGKLLFNPAWVQQHDALGQAYEPQARESEFRLYYDEDEKILILSEGIRKTIVHPVRNPGKSLSPVKLPGAPKPATVGPPKNGQKKKTTQEDEFFKSFQFGP